MNLKYSTILESIYVDAGCVVGFMPKDVAAPSYKPHGCFLPVNIMEPCLPLAA